MNQLKILGLAAIAALGLMVIAGAGTASASRLCKTTVEVCPAAWDWTTGTEIHAVLDSGTSLLEISGFPEDTCTGSTVQGKTTNTGSSTETVDGPIEKLSLGGCSDPTTKVLSGGTFEIHTDGDSGGGILTSKGTEVTIDPFMLGFDCIAKTGTGTAIGTMDEPVNGGSDATLTVNATVPLSGSGCPSTLKWTAEYAVTTPTPLYVSTS
jgi:hypothetical protein